MNLLGTLARVIATNPSTQHVCEALYQLFTRCSNVCAFRVVVENDAGPETIFARGEHGDADLLRLAISSAALARSEEQPLERFAMPFFIAGRVVGAVSVLLGAPVDDETLESMQTATLYAGTAIGNQRFAEAAERDALTGLLNRRGFDRTFELELRGAERHAAPLALILVDIDFFHSYNTNYGHLAGDVCLQEIAGVLAASLDRPSDVAARYGGEEFVLLLPGRDEREAVEAGRRVIDAIAELNREHRGSTLGRVSLSLGIAAADPSADFAPRQLLALADRRLYEAKEAGRNRYAASTVAMHYRSAHERFEARDNFPHEITPFVGRQRESDDIAQAFAASRLVTISGTGGAGKTRLALHAGRIFAQRCRHGARLLDLSAKRSSGEIVSALARLFGVPEVTGAEPLDALIDSLREMNALVVLDTCEHVLRACAEIASRILAGCPEITVLATSREALRVPGEAVYRLRGLQEPEAQALFEARSGLAAAPENREQGETIRAICAHLDGLPLAIELAAAQAAALGLDGLRAVVEQHRGTLEFSAHTPTERQENLYRTIDWSYGLLAPQEQELLQRLSVFSFGGSLQAARDVCAGGQLTAANVDAALAGLESKSLIEIDRARDAFRMAESMAAYGLTRLDGGEQRTIILRFCDWYARRSAELRLESGNSAYQAALRSNPAEIDNYALALHRLLEERMDVAAGAVLAANFAHYVSRLGWNAEARRWTSAALAHEAQIDEGTTARLYHVLAVTYGTVSPEAAERYARKALEVFERIGDRAAALHTTQLIATAYYAMGDYPRSRTMYLDCLEAYRGRKDEQRVAIVSNNVAAVELDGFCDSRAAIPYASEAVEIFRRVDPGYKLAASLETLGQAYYAGGSYAQALAHLEEAAAILEEFGHPVVTMTLSIAARAHLRLGDLQAARERLRRALEKRAESEAPPYLAYCIESFALLAVEQENHASAAALLGFAQSYRERRRTLRAEGHRADYEEAASRAANALGPEAARLQSLRGESMSAGDAFREALLL